MRARRGPNKGAVLNRSKSQKPPLSPEEREGAIQALEPLLELALATRLLMVQGTSNGANYSAAMGRMSSIGMAFVDGAPTPMIFLSEAEGERNRAKPLFAALADDPLGENGWPAEYLEIVARSLNWAADIGDGGYQAAMKLAGARAPESSPVARSSSAQCSRVASWDLAMEAATAGLIASSRLAPLAASAGFSLDSAAVAVLEAIELAASAKLAPISEIRGVRL